jgi:cobalt-zinc-cadmium efflux system outer membrane protein
MPSPGARSSPPSRASATPPQATRRWRAAARSLPDVNARIGYTHDDLTISGDQQNTVGLTLAFPLPVFDRGQHDGARADAKARELDAQAQGVRASAEADLTGLLRRRAFLQSTVTRLRTEGIVRSEGVLAATEKAFNAGQVSLTDLLLARRAHIDLTLNVLDLQFDHFSVRNDLRRALGLDIDATAATSREGE